VDADAVARHIDEHLDEHVAAVQRWVRQRSVSWDTHDGGVRAMAELAADDLRALGFAEVELVEGRFHPGVWAWFDAGAAVTLHTYAMLDTRPARSTQWRHDPWGADLVAVDGFARVLVGRGSLGAKGPFVAFLNALRSIIAVHGTLPVNLMVLAEGEEIMGSPSYSGFVERYRHRLQHVDASYCPSSAQLPGRRVSVGLGLKGMVVVELSVAGERWPGAPRRSVHSSAAGFVHGPPWRLAQALACLTEPDGTGCRVTALTDAWDVSPGPTSAESALLEQLVEARAGLDLRTALPLGGIGNVALEHHVVDGASLRRFLYGPTFNVAGLRSGFIGPGTGTEPFSVPSDATATIDIRSVSDLPPEAIVAALRAHLDDHGFDDVELDVLAAFDHHRTDPAHPLVRDLKATLERQGYRPEVWPIQAGGGPWTAVPRAFGVPCVRGAVPGGGRLGVDEYLVIDGDDRFAGLAETERCHAEALAAVAEALSD
jgi:acetylornithine deacetylase/succinyl-diaminopimelate desuccinylase-like protein